jgi:hypothetical protein
MNAIIGVPHAIASIMTRPNRSGQSVGSRNATASLAAKGDRDGYWDATMILIAFRHRLWAAELVRPLLGSGELR